MKRVPKEIQDMQRKARAHYRKFWDMHERSPGPAADRHADMADKLEIKINKARRSIGLKRWVLD